MKPLQDALRAEANRLDAELDNLRSIDLSATEDGGIENTIYESVSQLRLGIVLIRVLSRLVAHAPLHRLHEAFGAPGDFGYESRLGQALYALYQGNAHDLMPGAIERLIDIAIRATAGNQKPEFITAYNKAQAALIEVDALRGRIARLEADTSWERAKRCEPRRGSVLIDKAVAALTSGTLVVGIDPAAPKHVVEQIQAVLDELDRATTKFPTWPTDPFHALAVLGEEFGELTQAVLQGTYEKHKAPTLWRDAVRTEAIQTAAMTLRFVLSLDRYEYTRCEQHALHAPSAPPAPPAPQQAVPAMTINEAALSAVLRAPASTQEPTR